jgi:hypothetical protein
LGVPTGAKTKSRVVRVLLLAIGLGVAGLGVFGLVVWRAVSIERVEHDEALRRFTSVRASLGSREPLLEIDDTGRVTRRVDVPHRAPLPIATLCALAYQPAGNRVIRADVPVWFVRLKGPAAQIALSQAGVDLARLQLTASDLQRYGPALLVDHVRRDGGRILLWTE